MRARNWWALCLLLIPTAACCFTYGYNINGIYRTFRILKEPTCYATRYLPSAYWP